MKHYDLKKLFPAGRPPEAAGTTRLIVLHSRFKGEIGVYRLSPSDVRPVTYVPAGAFPKLSAEEQAALSPEAVDAAIREAIALCNVWQVPEEDQG